MKLLVLTDIPSPYQVEIFNQIGETLPHELHVVYLRSNDPNRRWHGPVITHKSSILNQNGDGVSKTMPLMDSADLVIFNYYFHPAAQELIAKRARDGRPWCFWGERPGFHKPEWMGQLVRQWKLRWLHSSAASIWGIGTFAVDGYREEFGEGRSYFNLPYFSNLKRFNNAHREERIENGARIILFSGALTRRKGVDLLLHAFTRLREEGHNIRLRILGTGPLESSIFARWKNLDCVEFLGFQDWSELPEYYATADVLCVPSRYDGWGLVVPEGLAAGLPVIATNRMGAALEFVQTGRNGWLIEAGNQNALFNALRDAATMSHQQLASCAARARESVSAHTLEEGARRFLKYSAYAVDNWQSN